MTPGALRPLLVGLLLTACPPARAAAQFPAELAGRVVETGTSRPIAGALVAAGAGRAVTDATGAFVLRVPDAGVVRVSVSHPAYAPFHTSRRLEAGRTHVDVFSLEPVPVALEGIEVAAEPHAGFVLDRTEIERSGARTLGELLRVVPGVVVREGAAGGTRISIRGSSADQVLVLVDGVPVNDPLTGEADADAVALQGIRSVQVVPGARSARFGARAAAGVVVVESDAARQPFASGSLEIGSLGALALQADAGARPGATAASAGIRYRGGDGQFSYDLPDELGGGRASRTNADEGEIGGYAAVALPAAGELRVRTDLSRLERGLPGPMHAPTPRSRQRRLRGDVRASWTAAPSLATLRVSGGASRQRVLHDDPAPAFGPAYHDTTDAREGSIRIEAERTGGVRLLRSVTAGAEARRTELESSALDPRRVARTDASAFVRGSVALPVHALGPRLDAAARFDRWNDGWIASHEVALSVTILGVTASAAQRSAFSPPAASDQFFAADFAIAPNPALEPERVRAELELAVSTALDVGRAATVDLGASAFRGDMDGMIVWAPDFRFVWSPRNRDVKRSGGEAWLRARALPDLELGAWAAVARVTYDWPGDADTVQVMYRPRHSAGLSARWTPADWSFSAEGIYTGVRYATPGHANPLPSYWDIQVGLGRAFRRGPFEGDAAIRIDRLLDNTDSFVHGYAEPGRRVSIEMRLRAAERGRAITMRPTDS